MSACVDKLTFLLCCIRLTFINVRGLAGVRTSALLSRSKAEKESLGGNRLGLGRTVGSNREGLGLSCAQVFPGKATLCGSCLPY